VRAYALAYLLSEGREGVQAAPQRAARGRRAAQAECKAQEKSPRAGRLQGPAARGGLAVGYGQARGASKHAKHAEHVAHVTSDRGLRVLSRTQPGKHARPKAQSHYKQEEGKRDTAREAGSVEFGLARSFSGGGRLKQR
jgi:hypothetical protein